MHDNSRTNLYRVVQNGSSVKLKPRRSLAGGLKESSHKVLKIHQKVIKKSLKYHKTLKKS